MLANRSTATATSGRRRAKPRTYPSTSTASFAKPPLGSDFTGVVSEKTAGWREAGPYTLVVDFTTSRRTVGDFWQAPSSCMVPMTLVSLAWARPPAPSEVPLTSRCTTVSTECLARILAITGCRMSARTNSAFPRSCSGGTASTAITRPISGSRCARRTNRPPSCRAAPVTRITLPTCRASCRGTRGCCHRTAAVGESSALTCHVLPRDVSTREVRRHRPGHATAPLPRREAVEGGRESGGSPLLLVAALHTRPLQKLAVLLLGHTLTPLLDDRAHDYPRFGFTRCGASEPTRPTSAQPTRPRRAKVTEAGAVGHQPVTGPSQADSTPT